MMPVCLDVHSMYGAIYRSGEFVQRGAVLGLSADRKSVVIAPISGWVRLPESASESPCQEPAQGLRVEVWRERPENL